MKKLIAGAAFALFGFLYASSQNIGIGVTTPAGKLDIRHTSTTTSPTLNLYDNNASNFSRLQFQTASGSKAWQIAGFLDNVTDANAKLNFYHSVFGDVLTLTGDGKAGVGIAAPAAKLDVAGNVRANSFRYTTARPFYYSVSGADFDAVWSWEDIAKDYGPIIPNGINGVWTEGNGLVAPVHLPNGATILNFTLFFTDTHPFQDLNVKLIEYDMSTDLNTVITEVTSAGTPDKSSITSTTISNNIVNNQAKNYKFVAKTASGNAWPGDLLILRGIQITYTVTEAQ